jgi:DNA-binding NtrC family response regulator
MISSAPQCPAVLTPPAAPEPVAQAEHLERRVLIVEDDPDTRASLQRLLQASLPVLVDTAADGTEGLEALTSQPYSIVVTDLKMPRLSGMQLIEEIQTRRLPVTVIVATGHGSIDEAVRAIQMGAYDFITKPPQPERLCLTIQRALRERTLLDEVAALREMLESRHTFQGVLSKHPRMLEIFELITHIAQATTTVLIEGETGTGKEVLARAIHQASAPVRPGPMVAVSCAALPETLLESELFGHEKGAYTGAVGQRKGRFEQAHGGTIFLDEVADIPPSMQVKLLRVLQDRSFERVGGSESIEVDVRVIGATNRPLQRLVRDGKFREDLYYRLNVVKVDVPPLRERPEDIPLLAAHFTQKYARPGQPPCRIAPEAMARLLAYRWPGNVRQLENVIEGAYLTARDGWLRPENLSPELVQRSAPAYPFAIDLSRPLNVQLGELTAAFEERFLRKALRRARGHIGRTARITGLSRRSITNKIALYQIDRSDYMTSE